jgi:hypothetical protein
MMGLCDTCDQTSELYQLAGRKDLNCSECYVTIETAIQLYQTLRETEWAGGDTSEVVTELTRIVRRLFDRVRLNTLKIQSGSYIH